MINKVYILLRPENIERAIDYMTEIDGVYQHDFVPSSNPNERTLCFICKKPKRNHLNFIPDDSLLDIPQIIELCRTRNAKTISYLLVFSWFCGDIFKFGYYTIKNAPLQLIGCSLFQLSTDIFVIFQLWYYTKNGKSDTVPITASETVRNANSIIDGMNKTEISNQ